MQERQVDGQEVKGKPGTLVFVPAGTQHGLRNDSAARWLLRETVHERVYARTAPRLLGRATLTRLSLIGRRWRRYREHGERQGDALALACQCEGVPYPTP